MRASVAIGRVRIARQPGGISNPAPYHSIAGMRSVLSSGWRARSACACRLDLGCSPRDRGCPRSPATNDAVFGLLTLRHEILSLMRSWAGYRYSLDRIHLRRPGLTSVMTLSII